MVVAVITWEVEAEVTGEVAEAAIGVADMEETIGVPIIGADMVTGVAMLIGEIEMIETGDIGEDSLIGDLITTMAIPTTIPIDLTTTTIGDI